MIRADWHRGRGESAAAADAEELDLPRDRLLRLPMRPGQRSLNLSNSVAVLVYEAWRQQAFSGAE